MNYIKWFAVLVFSLMTFWALSWVISLYILKSSVEAMNSRQHDSLEDMHQQQVKMAKDIIQETNTLFTPIKAPTRPVKVAHIKFTENKVITADKLCNDAILAAMGDRSDEAQQTKKNACAHNKNK